MLGAQGSELANLVAQLKNPEVIQDQLKDLDQRRDLAGQAEQAAKTAQAEADETLREAKEMKRRAEAAVTRMEATKTRREERLTELEESLAEREQKLKTGEDALAVKTAEADGREKNTKRDSNNLQARIARHKEKEAKLAAQAAVIDAFMQEAARLKAALEG